MEKIEKELMNEKFKGMYQFIENGFDKLDAGITSIQKYNESQDDKIAKAIDQIAKNKDNIEKNTTFISKLENNPIIRQVLKRAILLIIIGFILLLIILGFISVDQILDLKKYKIW